MSSKAGMQSSVTRPTRLDGSRDSLGSSAHPNRSLLRASWRSASVWRAPSRSSDSGIRRRRLRPGLPRRRRRQGGRDRGGLSELSRVRATAAKLPRRIGGICINAFAPQAKSRRRPPENRALRASATTAPVTMRRTTHGGPWQGLSNRRLMGRGPELQHRSYRSVIIHRSRHPKQGKESHMADRRAGRVPHVRDEGGGKQPRSRTDEGRWRRKRSDAGKPRRARRSRSRCTTSERSPELVATAAQTATGAST